MTQYDHVKDSGQRETFSTGSVRDTRQGKGRYDLIPPYPLHRLAVHYENGAQKYGDRNWERGQPVSRYLDSAIRHAFKYIGGSREEDHLAAVAWNALAAIYTIEKCSQGFLPAELDDLPTPTQAPSVQYRVDIDESAGSDCTRGVIYIAGPMRGLPDFNFDAFFEAEARWQGAGWTVRNPARMDSDDGFDPNMSDKLMDDPDLLRWFAKRDLKAILEDATAVAVLQGWEASKGACMEIALADFIGLPVYDAATMDHLRETSHD